MSKIFVSLILAFAASIPNAGFATESSIKSSQFGLIRYENPYHSDEIPDKLDEGWIALTDVGQNYALKPVRLEVSMQRSPDDDENGPFTDKILKVFPKFEGHTLIFLRPPVGTRFKQGNVEGSTPLNNVLVPGRTFKTKLRAKAYQLKVTSVPDKAGGKVTKSPDKYTITLTKGKKSQKLFTLDSFSISADGDGVPAVEWMEDLDGDGKLDVLLNLTTHYNVTRLTLFLSSAAKGNDLVGKVAEHVMMGC